MRTDTAMNGRRLQRTSSVDPVARDIAHELEKHIQNFNCRALDRTLLHAKRRFQIHDLCSGRYAFDGKSIIRKVITNSNGSAQMVRILTDHGVNFREQIQPKSESAVHLTATIGDKRLMKYFIKRMGIPVNDTDYHGQTALHYTMFCSAGSTQIAKTLLKQGADVNRADNKGTTPLHITMQTMIHEPILKSQLLLQRGASVNQTDSEGNSPLHVLVSYRPDELIKKIELLIKYKINRELMNKNGKTALDIFEETSCPTLSFFEEEKIKSLLNPSVRQSPSQHRRALSLPATDYNLAEMELLEVREQPRRRSTLSEKFCSLRRSIRNSFSPKTSPRNSPGTSPQYSPNLSLRRSINSEMTDYSDTDESDYDDFSDYTALTEEEMLEQARKFGQQFNAVQMSEINEDDTAVDEYMSCTSAEEPQFNDDRDDPMKKVSSVTVVPEIDFRSRSSTLCSDISTQSDTEHCLTDQPDHCLDENANSVDPSHNSSSNDTTRCLDGASCPNLTADQSNHRDNINHLEQAAYENADKELCPAGSIAHPSVKTSLDKVQIPENELHVIPPQCMNGEKNPTKEGNNTVTTLPSIPLITYTVHNEGEDNSNPSELRRSSNITDILRLFEVKTGSISIQTCLDLESFLWESLEKAEDEDGNDTWLKLVNVIKLCMSMTLNADKKTLHMLVAISTRNQHWNLAKKLIESVFYDELDLTLNKRDDYGWAAVHYAARYGRLETIRLLDRASASLLRKIRVAGENDSQQSARSIAQHYGYEEIVRYIDKRSSKSRRGSRDNLDLIGID